MSKKIRARAEAGITTKNESTPKLPKLAIENIRQSITEVAGEPPKDVRVVVKHLWDDRFRINIYWQENHGSEWKMIHSHFVRATETEIISTEPAFCPFAIPVVQEKGLAPLGKV